MLDLDILNMHVFQYFSITRCYKALSGQLHIVHHWLSWDPWDSWLLGAFFRLPVVDLLLPEFLGDFLFQTVWEGSHNQIHLADRSHNLINLFSEDTCIDACASLEGRSFWHGQTGFNCCFPLLCFHVTRINGWWVVPRAAFQWQAMSELWEEDEALRKALPWNALTLRAPQNEMRQT